MSATVDAQRFVIGYHASVAGRITRLLVGGLGLFTGLSTLVPHPANWWVAGLAVAGAVIFYAGIHRLVLWQPVAREPWLGTFFVLAPLGLLGIHGVPAGVRLGVDLYIGVSLVITAAMAYGGCEVVAIPSLVSGRRPTVYCPFNAVDAAERPLAAGTGGAIRVLSTTIAVAVGVYFVFVGQVLDAFGIRMHTPPVAAAPLLVPAAALGWWAWRCYRRDHVASLDVRAPAVGAFALLAATIVFSGLADQEVVWGAIMVAGLALAGTRIIRGSLRRHRAPDPSTAR